MYCKQMNTLSQTGNSSVSLERKTRSTKRSKKSYDEPHRVRSLDPLPNNSTVWIRTNNTLTPEIVLDTANTPRSYMISTPMGQLRRNRSHLLNRRVTSEDTTSAEEGPAKLENRSPVMTCSRTGVQLKTSRETYFIRRGDVV